MADYAALDDGKFDVYVVRPGAFWQLLLAVTHLRFGFTKPNLLKRDTATRVSLRTRRPRPINVDGELDGVTPARFELRPAVLKVILPPTLTNDHRGLTKLR